MRADAPNRTGDERRDRPVRPFARAETSDARRVLGPVLRRLRRRRGMTAADMAEALDVDIRTYERLAAGRTQLDLPRIRALADALNADPLGLAAALLTGRPGAALAAADAKPLLILALALDRLSTRQVELLAGVPATAVVAACDRLVSELVAPASACTNARPG